MVLLGTTRHDSACGKPHCSPVPREGKARGALTCLHQRLLLLHHVGGEIKVTIVYPIQAL